ncbi:uncharacterized protein LOC106651448 isoform X1 [Trichogramma pretiosum]|uniref:uncharacterized protein LOC106651448 isoform X1 n=2 Tax=Trichogramma pretiosum TaxID=7493 RepID=UPI0006C94A7E|nr:uncharacterized protein LOC106651448 isoform X1 [Trichogramma pretiosum]
MVVQQQPEITKRIILEPRRGSLIDENEQFITHEIEHYRLIAEPYPNAHVSPDPKDPPDVEDVDEDEDDEVFEIETETTTTEPTTTTGPSLPSAYEVSNELQLKNDINHEKEEDIGKQAEDDQTTTNTLSDFLVTEETTDDNNSSKGGGQSSIVATDKLYQDIDELVVTPSSNCSSGSGSSNEDKNNGHLLTDDLLLDEITEDDSSKYNDNEFKDLSSATFIEHEIPEPISLKEASGVDEKSCSFYETEARSPEPTSVDNDDDESNSSLSISNIPTTTTQTVSTDVTDFKDNNTNTTTTKSSDWLDDHHRHVDKELSPVSIVVTQAAEEPQQQPQSLQSLPSLHDQCSVGSTPYDSGNFYSQEGKFENYLEKSGSRLLEEDDGGDLAPLATPDEISEISNAASNDSESREEVITTSSVVSSTKKKKKIEATAGSDASPNHTKTKKTKKSKKSELEKENISVKKKLKSKESKKESLNMHTGPRQTSAEMIEISAEDDLSNVNVKSLTQTYALESSHRGDLEKPNKEIIATGVSIKQLCRSFGDVSNMNDADKNTTLTNSDSNRHHERAKSTGDLSFDEQDRCKYFTGRDVVFASVNVKALRASYNNLANLQRSVSDCPKRRYTRSCSDRIRPVADLFEKSSFNKFDALTKKSGAVLHVRSVDASKVQQQLNSVAQNGDANPNCRSCGKVVFQMEQTKAEGLVWHKNCFRCCQCSKQLSVDSYESHESTLYCKPHFKELFQPKPVEESDQPMRPRKPEMIIRENQPKELPPDVVRASDKPDLGLEELSALNVKSRFQVFEKANNHDNHLNEIERSPSQVAVKRSPSILSKLAKFQAKGMDIGVTDDALNGIPYEESSESDEEIEEEETEEVETETTIIKSNRGNRERPISFTKMDDIKNRWESTSREGRKESLREARKEEIAGIRSRLFMGKQGKMKEMYQQAVADSDKIQKINAVEEIQHSTNARSIKERFERGEPIAATSDEEIENAKNKSEKPDEEILAAGISRKSRSLFLEMDATAAKTGRPVTPNSQSKAPETPTSRRARDAFMGRQVSDDVVRSSDQTEEVKVETSDISNKFKFFETYREPEKTRKQFRITPPRDGQVKLDSPDREIYRDPEVVRADDRATDDIVHTDTARKMLGFFRQMEEKATKEDLPDGPKPLKRFTPPPEDKFGKATASESGEEEEEADESEDEEQNPNYVRASDKVEDEFLKQANNGAVRAKTLRAKFEQWETSDAKAAATNNHHHVAEMDMAQTDGSQPSIESASSLRARFESLGSTPQEAPRTPKVKVNRFVEIQTNCIDVCESCEKKVYPLEKVETNNKIFHKQCFRCLQCNCILRMDTFTLNNGKLYCIPHFKQLFITRGNYDEGFGVDPHKNKWTSVQQPASITVSNGDV